MSNIVIVLAMHGAPPNDFPSHEVAELFGLQHQLPYAQGPVLETLQHRHAELENRMRLWPRTARNDPFYAGSQELAVHLGEVTGCKVIVGFNEFCAPSVDQALDYATAQTPEKIIVITPMLTQGGEHAEVDIPNVIRRARQRHPHTLMVYAWPFEVSAVAQFLAAQMTRLIDEGASHQRVFTGLP
jgi:sirohydrochlorin cobaltochelatase